MSDTVPKLPLKQEIVDTLIICATYVATAFMGGGWPFRILIGFCFVMSIIEIYVNAAYADANKNNVSVIRCSLMTVVLMTAALAIFYKRLRPEQYVLWIGTVTAANAGGLFFGRIFGKRRPFLTRRISPNKTYAGYIGEALSSVIAGWLIIAIMKIPLQTAAIYYASTGFVACVIGDLLGSAAKRELGIKNSEENLLDKPVLGKIEKLMRSRHGFLDCFDSASVAFIYFIILL